MIRHTVTAKTGTVHLAHGKPGELDRPACNGQAFTASYRVADREAEVITCQRCRRIGRI